MIISKELAKQLKPALSRIKSDEAVDLINKIDNVLPEYNFDEIRKEEKFIKKTFKKCNIIISGSQVICPDYVNKESDFDYAVHSELDEKLIKIIKDNGYEHGGSFASSNKFASFKKKLNSGETINIILIPSKVDFDAFALATEICTTLDLENKEIRCKIFDQCREDWRNVTFINHAQPKRRKKVFSKLS